jgi:AcrR family transcriptional regulator
MQNQLNQENTQTHNRTQSPKRKTNKRELILTKARTMILEQGLDNFSMKKLCQELGMAQSGIFYYFKNSSTLLEEIIETQVTEEVNFLLTQVQLTKKPKKAAKQFFYSYIEYYINRPELYRLIQNQLISMELSDKFIESLISRYDDLYVYLKHITPTASIKKKIDYKTALESLRLQANSIVMQYFLTQKSLSYNINDVISTSWRQFNKSVFNE